MRYVAADATDGELGAAANEAMGSCCVNSTTSLPDTWREVCERIEERQQVPTE